MTAKHKTHKTKDGAFEYGFVGHPSEMAGRMEPFRRHWWAQAMSNGVWETFRTKAEMNEWIKDWYRP